MAIVNINIDDAEVRREIEFLRQRMTTKQFIQAMYGVFRDTGRHIGTILKQDLPPQYYVKAGDITATVKPPKMQMGGNTVGCIIPLRGSRKSIGGYYAASGSASGWQSVHKKYRVTARIVKGGQSKLPGTMDNYGGMPPFRNIPSKLGNVTFTRGGGGRFPIQSVVGIAIPQMPMTRSRPDVERDIDEYLKARIHARVGALLANGR